MVIKTKKITTGGQLLLISSIAIALYGSFSSLFNVYKYALTGAIFEIIWLPFLISIPVVFLISFYQWAKAAFSLKSFYLYPVILVSLTVLLMVIRNSK